MSDIQDVKLGIIGVGNMGSDHARNLRENKVPGMRLAALCDTNPERLKDFSEVPGFTAPEEFFAKADIDAVLIATPHYDHVPLGVEALQKGLHTLVEKPIAVHKAAAQKLVDASGKSQALFAAMFNQRTDPRYQWVKKQIDSGSLGKITRISWIITTWFRSEAYYRNGDWRATWAGEGGGVLLNQCPHQLDLWQWFFGLPDMVRAFCRLGHYHDIEVEDEVTAYLEYQDGPTGTFITTTGEAPGTNRLEIVGDDASMVIEGDGVRVYRLAESTSEFSRTTPGSFGVPPKACEEVIKFEGSGEQHIGIMKNFAAAIRDGKPLIAPGAEGIRSVELGNAMLYSGLTEQAVNMPLDAEAYEAKLTELIKSSRFVKKAPVAAAPVADMSASFTS